MNLQDIIEQNLVKPLDFLAEDSELCRQIQSRLKDIGLLPSNGVDGIYGSQTQTAIAGGAGLAQSSKNEPNSNTDTQNPKV